MIEHVEEQTHSETDSGEFEFEDEESENASDQMQALTGYSNPQTMRVSGYLKTPTHNSFN